MAVGSGVDVGGTEVAVGDGEGVIGVAVGVGGIAVWVGVGGIGVSVGKGVAVGGATVGAGVEVGTGSRVGKPCASGLRVGTEGSAVSGSADAGVLVGLAELVHPNTATATANATTTIDQVAMLFLIIDRTGILI